jgi:hypothetical protein
MELFLPEAWRCPPDYVISDAADRRMQRLMSRFPTGMGAFKGAFSVDCRFRLLQQYIAPG